MCIEVGRYSRPNPTPINERTCKYCPDEALDNEAHFLLSCRTFAIKRECFFNKMSCVVPNFRTLSDQDKLLTILCPATPAAVKVSNKFIAILFSNRKRLDEGTPLNNLTFPPQVDFNLENLSDLSEGSEASLSDFSEIDSSFSSSNLNYNHDTEI